MDFFFHGLHKEFSRLDIGYPYVQVLRYFLAVPVRKQRDELFFFLKRRQKGEWLPCCLVLSEQVVRKRAPTLVRALREDLHS